MSTIVHSLREYRSPTRAQQFAIAFSLPEGEAPFVDADGNQAEIDSCVLSLSNPGSTHGQEDLVYAGRLTLTQSFLCFASLGDRGRGCRMSLPLCTVRRVERLNTRDSVFALSITVWHGMQLILQLNALRTTCDVFCGALRDRLRAHLDAMKQVKPFLATCYSEHLLAHPDEVGKGKDRGTEEEPPDAASTTAEGEAPYHMGLGAQFGFPGDPKKYVPPALAMGADRQAQGPQQDAPLARIPAAARAEPDAAPVPAVYPPRPGGPAEPAAW